MKGEQRQVAQAAELADTLFGFMPLVVKHVNDRLEDLGLTNTDYWALRSIHGPMPMKELAHCMDYDPSYVTIVADRLEELGLIERQPHPTDRRVKHLVLTPRGRELQTVIPEMLWTGDHTFSALSDAEQKRLAEILAKLALANR